MSSVAGEEGKVTALALGPVEVTATYEGQTGRATITGVNTLGTIDAPSISLASGQYAGTQIVTLSSSLAGASIRYTTDGSTPTSSSGTLYSGALTVSADVTLKAIAYKNNYTDSS